MLDFLNEPYECELRAFGKHWCGPKILEHGERNLIARYEKDDGSDGQSVEVYAIPMPARFYVIKVLAGENSIGDAKPAWELGTGSGQHSLAAKIAEAVRAGMLALHGADETK
jgi:hypothetical protein